MCYPGVLESLSQRFEAKVFMIPSSIHECMVIPDYECVPGGVSFRHGTGRE